MLCSLGIVTEKELADDLTVISDEHIEERVHPELLHIISYSYHISILIDQRMEFYLEVAPRKLIHMV